MDLAPPLIRLLADLAQATANTPKPFVTVFFGNPYVPMALPSLPVIMLTYDFYDQAEASAVRAIAGEAPIVGRLPVTLPGMFDAGSGLRRE